MGHIRKLQSRLFGVCTALIGESSIPHRRVHIQDDWEARGKGNWAKQSSQQVVVDLFSVSSFNGRGAKQAKRICFVLRSVSRVLWKEHLPSTDRKLRFDWRVTERQDVDGMFLY